MQQLYSNYIAVRAVVAVKREVEHRRGITEQLAVHRTETEMYCQYMLDGVPQLVATVHRIGASLFTEASS